MMKRRGVELVWWALLVIIIAIVTLLIFYVFIRSGIIQLKIPIGNIYGGLQVVENTT